MDVCICVWGPKLSAIKVVVSFASASLMFIWQDHVIGEIKIMAAPKARQRKHTNTYFVCCTSGKKLKHNNWNRNNNDNKHGPTVATKYHV